MSMFVAAAKLSAENFKSGDATGGQVFTADGEGGATWEDPIGFAFDSVEFDAEEYVAEQGWRFIYIQLQAVGDVAPDGVYCFPIIVRHSNWGDGYVGADLASGESPYTIALFSSAAWPEGNVWVHRQTENSQVITLQISNSDVQDQDALVYIGLPTGAMTGYQVTIPGVTP